MDRSQIDKIVSGIVIWVIGSVVVWAIGLFLYFKFLVWVPWDLESSRNQTVFSPVFTYEQALSVAMSWTGDIDEISLEADDWILYREVEFTDDRYIYIDANNWNIISEWLEEDNDWDYDD